MCRRIKLKGGLSILTTFKIKCFLKAVVILGVKCSTFWIWFRENIFCNTLGCVSAQSATMTFSNFENFKKKIKKGRFIWYFQILSMCIVADGRPICSQLVYSHAKVLPKFFISTRSKKLINLRTKCDRFQKLLVLNRVFYPWGGFQAS